MIERKAHLCISEFKSCTRYCCGYHLEDRDDEEDDDEEDEEDDEWGDEIAMVPARTHAPGPTAPTRASAASVRACAWSNFFNSSTQNRMDCFDRCATLSFLHAFRFCPPPVMSTLHWMEEVLHTYTHQVDTYARECTHTHTHTHTYTLYTHTYHTHVIPFLRLPDSLVS